MESPKHLPGLPMQLVRPTYCMNITQFSLHLYAVDILAKQLYGSQSCTNYKQPNVFIAPLVDDVLFRNYLKTLCALMSQFSESQVTTLQHQYHPMFRAVLTFWCRNYFSNFSTSCI